MANINDISNNLTNQLKILESNVTEASYKFKDVEGYINKRFKKLKKLIPLVSKSKNWTNRLSSIIDLFEEVQKVLEKMEELEGSIINIKEVSIDDIELVEQGIVDV